MQLGFEVSSFAPFHFTVFLKQEFVSFQCHMTIEASPSYLNLHVYIFLILWDYGKSSNFCSLVTYVIHFWSYWQLQPSEVKTISCYSVAAPKSSWPVPRHSVQKQSWMQDLQNVCYALSTFPYMLFPVLLAPFLQLIKKPPFMRQK